MGRFYPSLPLAFFLVGCSSQPSARSNSSHVPDWGGLAARPVAPPPAPSVPAAAEPPRPTEPSAAAVLREIRSNTPAETWIPFYRWCSANGYNPPTRLGGGIPPAYALTTTNGVLILRAGSQVAHWEGIDIRLGFAPQIFDGQPLVHTLDLAKTIGPLAGGLVRGPLKANPVIVIDPGHGGEDAGTRSALGSANEKEFTLDWARRLAALLTTKGWLVLLTRTGDTDLALSNRVAFAEDHRAGLFLSLHFNSAAPNDAEAGLETYCLTPAGLPSTVTRGFGDDPSIAFPNNALDAENLGLAFRVHSALLQVNGGRDRGIRRARFLGVLRGQQRPAILIEGGYLSNPREARLIAQPEYRQRLAEAVAFALTGDPARKEPAAQTAKASP